MPLNGTIKLNAWVQNARVLDSNNSLQSNLYPPDLIKDIANNYLNSFKTRIFNMSISSSRGHITTRMSKWAESIDREIFENDILFILPTGNIFKDEIASQISSGAQYPDYLFKRKNRIADPSHSLLSITVGSICSDTFEDLDRKSFGEKDFPSSFSRTGLGIWESIKPELVEYGGDYVFEKNQPTPLISQNEDTNIDLIRSTLNGGPSTSKDAIGTSFTAPRISSIIAKLQKFFPEESTLLYKALIIQSARWPNNVFINPNPRLNFIRLFGYGIPNLKRATTNDDFRVSLVSSGIIVPKKADVYEVKIPDEIRRIGDSYDILIEVTLTFKAKPRRTRRGFRSYFSGWADWQSSKFGESIDAFRERLVTNIDDDDYEESDNETINQEKIPWVIGSRSNAGINGVKLNNNTSQKDWAIVKSNILTESFCLGIIGHAGWDKDLKSEIPYSVVVSFEAINKDIEIYNRISIENPVEVRINT
nr:S8 family peptidase [Wocania ichthyoenteri]